MCNAYFDLSSSVKPGGEEGHPLKEKEQLSDLIVLFYLFNKDN